MAWHRGLRLTKRAMAPAYRTATPSLPISAGSAKAVSLRRSRWEVGAGAVAAGSGGRGARVWHLAGSTGVDADAELSPRILRPSTRANRSALCAPVRLRSALHGGVSVGPRAVAKLAVD